MRKLLSCTAVSVIVIATGGCFAVAQAQQPAEEAQQAEQAPKNEVRKLDQVTVTAVRREQDLTDVPVAVTAFTADLRQDLALDTLTDFARFTPSLTYSAGDERVFIRGVGRETNTNGSDPGVATYADGIYDASTQAVSKSDFFVERVEVLRGPQGTLYGRNSIGGAINVISKRPTAENTAEARFRFGNYDTKGVEASVSGPLGDMFRAKLAGSYNDQGKGYYKNVAGGPSEGGASETTYLEAQIEADLTENFSIWMKADTTDGTYLNRSTNYSGAYDAFPFPTGFLTPGAAFGYSQADLVLAGTATTNPGTTDIREFNTNTPTRAQRDDDFGFSAAAEWNLQNIDLKYQGGYRTYLYNANSDDDQTNVLSYSYPLDPANIAAGEVFTGGPNCAYLLANVGPLCSAATIFPQRTFGYQEDKDFWSHEITAQSSGESDLWWIAGAYIYDEDYHQEARFGNAAQPELLAPVGAAPNPSGDYVTAISDINTRSYAVFGQVDYSLNETITLTGGLRYSKDEKKGSEDLRILAFGLIPGFTVGGSGSLAPALDLTASALPTTVEEGVASDIVIDPDTGLANRRLSNDWDAVSGVLGIQWQPDDASNYYARYSRGYKAGGFNAGGISQFPQTDKELLDAFEIGTKQSISSDLQFNASAYYYIYDGKQVPLDVQENGIQLTKFFNLEEARASGIELEAIWTPTEQLRFMGSYAYNDSEVRDACCFVDVVDPFALQPGAQPSGPAAATNQTQDLKGEMLPRTVPHKFGLNASYDIPLQHNGDLTLSANYSWQDATYHGVFNRAYTKTPSSDQFDLIGVWNSPQDNYRIVGYVKNVFDEQGFDGASGVLSVFPAGITQKYFLTAPRTYGVQLQLRF